MAYLLTGSGVRHKPPLHPSQSPSRRLRRTSQKTRNPVHRPPKQNVGKKRQYEGHNQRLQRIEPTKNNNLIEQVHNDGEDEHSGDCFESFAQPASPIRRVCEERIEVSGAPFPRIFQTVTNREDHRHRRLEQKSKRHRSTYPADQIVPQLSEYLFHFQAP
jgi:hypothetical protein